MIRNPVWPLILSIPISLAGCFGDDEVTPPAIDAGGDLPDAADEPDAAPTPSCTCVALGVDYMAGVGTLATISLPGLAVTPNRAPGAVSGDPVVRAWGDGRVYVVNRFGADNVTILDDRTFQVIDQFSTGAGSNPQDVAVYGDKIYVAALALGVIQVYDAADLGAPPVEIDLSAYDPDGTPDPSSIHTRGDRVYVTLGRLDSSFLPTDNGLVVVIDPADDSVETTFELNHQNPTGFLRPHGTDALLVSTAEDYSGTIGCLERIDTAPAGVAPCVVDNAEVMGTVSSIADADGELYLAVTGFDAMFEPFGKLVHVPSGGAAIDPAGIVPDEQVVNDVGYCAATRQLVYSDAAMGGVRVLDTATRTEVTTQPLDLGLPPAFSSGIACY